MSWQNKGRQKRTPEILWFFNSGWYYDVYILILPEPMLCLQIIYYITGEGFRQNFLRKQYHFHRLEFFNPIIFYNSLQIKLPQQVKDQESTASSSTSTPPTSSGPSSTCTGWFTWVFFRETNCQHIVFFVKQFFCLLFQPWSQLNPHLIPSKVIPQCCILVDPVILAIVVSLPMMEVVSQVLHELDHIIQ